MRVAHITRCDPLSACHNHDSREEPIRAPNAGHALTPRARASDTRSDLSVYQELTRRVAAEVESTFGVSGVKLTSPTFFSRISADKPPKIPNDEYWHSHVDQLQYGSFVYTALLYLSEVLAAPPAAVVAASSPHRRPTAPHRRSMASTSRAAT